MGWGRFNGRGRNTVNTVGILSVTAESASLGGVRGDKETREKVDTPCRNTGHFPGKVFRKLSRHRHFITVV